MTKKKAVLFFVMFCVAAPMALATNFATAASTSSAKGEVCQGLGQASVNCSTNQGGDISRAMAAVLNLLSLIAGFITVIMLIISGVRFTTANGDSSGISGARTSLIYALVGIVVVLMSQVIVHFVLGKFTHR